MDYSVVGWGMPRTFSLLRPLKGSAGKVSRIIGFLGVTSWTLGQGNKKNPIHNRELRFMLGRSIKPRRCPPRNETALFVLSSPTNICFLSLSRIFPCSIFLLVNSLICIKARLLLECGSDLVWLLSL